MELKPGYKLTEAGMVPEDWTVRTLGSVSETSSGTTPSRALYDRYYARGTIPWVKTLDLNNSEILKTEENVTDFALKETCLQIYPPGTVLVAMYGGFNQIGRTGFLTIPATVNQALTAIRPNTKVINPKFLLYLLNLRVDYWKGVASSSRKDPNITSYDVRSFPFAHPSLPEQEAIAIALSDTDVFIDCLGQLISKKRLIKQGAMQELLTYKKRLTGFNGRWEKMKLGEISKVTKGQQLNDSEISKNGGYAYLNGGILPSGFTNQSNTKGNTIAISEGGNSCGYVQFMIKSYWCGGHCYSVIPNDVDNYFLFQALKSRQSSIMGLRVGSGLPNVQKTALLDFEILYPLEKGEQTAIGKLLFNMDGEIAALEKKLAITNQIKQGMMQNLLTGRIRLT